MSDPGFGHREDRLLGQSLNERRTCHSYRQHGASVVDPGGGGRGGHAPPGRI